MGQGYGVVGDDQDIQDAVQEVDQRPDSAPEGRLQDSIGNAAMLERLHLDGGLPPGGAPLPEEDAHDETQPAPETAPPAPETTPPVQGPTPAPEKDKPAPPGPRHEITAEGGPDQKTLDALKSSPNPKDKQMAAVIERARTQYADYMTQTGARLIVTSSEGNDGHPVVMVVPKGYDPSGKTEIHTHYHGNDSTVSEKDSDSGAGLLHRMRETQKNPQAVFVLPASKTEGSGNLHGASDWTNVKSVTKTTDDALRTLGVSEDKINDPKAHNVAERVVSAHSGGGSALTNAICEVDEKGNPRRDKNGQVILKDGGAGLKADRLELRDCLYNFNKTEEAVRAWSGTENGQAVKQVLHPRTSNASATGGGSLARAFGDRYSDQLMPIWSEGDKRNPHDRSNTIVWGTGPDGGRPRWRDAGTTRFERKL